MFNSIKDFFQAQFDDSDINADRREHTLNLATAALLIEISRSDDSIQTEELQLIEKTIREKFDISAEEALELIELARQEVEASVSLHEFTRILNEQLDRPEKAHIVELLWQVAFADGVLDKYEEYYVRKIADLLYVSQQEYIKAKHRAQEDNI